MKENLRVYLEELEERIEKEESDAAAMQKPDSFYADMEQKEKEKREAREAEE